MAAIVIMILPIPVLIVSYYSHSLLVLFFVNVTNMVTCLGFGSIHERLKPTIVAGTVTTTAQSITRYARVTRINNNKVCSRVARKARVFYGSS